MNDEIAKTVKALQDTVQDLVEKYQAMEKRYPKYAWTALIEGSTTQVSVGVGDRVPDGAIYYTNLYNPPSIGDT